MRYETKRTLARIAFLAVVAWTIIAFLFLGLIIYLYSFSTYHRANARLAQRLTSCVAHDQAGVQFLDGPGRREAALGHRRESNEAAN
jgi:predicted ferric reductase